jgi:molecular chaperone DnaJ
VKSNSTGTKRKNIQAEWKRLPSVSLIASELIYVNIWTPRKLSEEEKKILEKLGSSPNFKPQPSKTEKGFFERMKDYFS